MGRQSKIKPILNPVPPKTVSFSRLSTTGTKSKKRSGFVPVASSARSTGSPAEPTRDASGEGHGGDGFGMSEGGTWNSDAGVAQKSSPLQSWLKDREIYLSEEIRREGRMGHTYMGCPRCPSSGDSKPETPSYRCKECEGFEMVCGPCIIRDHRRNGLHHIEKWDGDMFHPTTLHALGFRFQLGHPIGKECPHPIQPHNDDFVVIHTNGVHEVGMNFCGCASAPERSVQLLRNGWFPGTTKLPRVAATLTALKTFQILSFESKCSAFEYHQSLMRLSDNTGIKPRRDRYRAFLAMIREYRNLKMLKRAGRAHAENGIANTKAGECAVLCPACPQPGRNLPDGWDKAPDNVRWLYCLFLAIDANFRLKRRSVSSEEADPSFSQGWAYFVDHGRYMKHLTNHGGAVQPKSTCSSHSAVNNSRLTEGLAASGVGSVGCARHDCLRPHSVGDLQKGERYVNMDFLFFSSLEKSSDSDSGVLEVVVSYDIACQWSVHLWQRMQGYDVTLHIPETEQAYYVFLVPKFHLPAHVESCQTKYSFNYTARVGRTDGEAREREWSRMNPIASSTAEMGPGSRCDTLNDHCGDWNWKKTIYIGIRLLRKIKEAVEESGDHMFRFHQFQLGLEKELKDDIVKWEAEILAWERDQKMRNPFEPRVQRLTPEGVRRALAEEDRQAQNDGTSYALHPLFSASDFISVGLELEGQQRRLLIDAKATTNHASDDQRTKILVRGNTLLRRIQQWMEVQELYMPATKNLRREENSIDSSTEKKSTFEPYEIPLLLPSSIPHPIPCDPRLRDLEKRLRSAQAHSALDELRRSLRLRAYLYLDKDRYSRGQRQNTKSRSLIERTDVKVTSAADRYRVARKAIESLSGSSDGSWRSKFPPLRPEDIKSIPVERTTQAQMKKMNKGESEGRRKASWIWNVLGESNTPDRIGDDSLKDDLRIEWCKSRARAKRWQEEVLLLKEEMRRVLAFLESEAAAWSRRAAYPLFNSDDATQEGYRAFGLEQANLRLSLRAHFINLWQYVDNYIRLGGTAKIFPDEAIRQGDEGTAT